ncbi:M23 family metallopeptidase [Dietzia aurantiaca]|uniref:M23 family metallopeptidase n=1 Tax=Dietzia aurantiaca TaxID=983873 RepID=A0ABV9PRR1_9ACTN
MGDERGVPGTVWIGRAGAGRAGAAAVVVAVAGLLLATVLPHPAAPAAPTVRLRSPVPGQAIPVTGFDPPDHRWLAGHRGVDLAAEPLSPVLAPAPGTVLFAGSVGGKPVLSLDHGDGLRTTYEPVTASVREGDEVSTGQTVGHVVAGHPGCPRVACLHWGARVASGSPGGDDDSYVDPLSLILASDRPIRLKPTRPGDGEA